MSVAIGIDLGTHSSSVCAFLESGEMQMSADVRSVVQVYRRDKLESVRVAEQVDNTGGVARCDAKGSVLSVKRLLGVGVDRAAQLSQFMAQQVEVDCAGLVRVVAPYQTRRSFHPVEFFAMLLRERFAAVGGAVDAASRKDLLLVVVPAAFGFEQRQLVMDAGTIAGLNIARTVSVCEAILSDFANSRADAAADKQDVNVLAFDIGAGFAEVALGTIQDDLVVMDDLRGVEIGGDDFDDILIQLWLDLARKDLGREVICSILNDGATRARLRANCAQGKKQLQIAEIVTIELTLPADSKLAQFTITRDAFESACAPLVARVLEMVAGALAAAAGAPETKIDHVLVGGGCFGLLAIRSFFDANYPRITMVNTNKAAAAKGAALMAASLLDFDRVISPSYLMCASIAHTLSVRVRGGQIASLVSAGMSFPTKRTICLTINGLEHDSKHWLQIVESGGGRSPARLLWQIENHVTAQSSGSLKLTVDIDANKVIKVFLEEVGRQGSEKRFEIGREACQRHSIAAGDVENMRRCLASGYVTQPVPDGHGASVLFH